MVIDFLGKRGDAACAPALLQLAENGEPSVRIAAVKALTRLVHAPVVSLLAKLATAPETDLADTARECLASFPGKAADEAVLSVLASSDAAGRCFAAGLIAHRGHNIAVPALMKAASSDPDETVRLAALKELRELAGMGELDALLKILLESKSAPVIQATTHAIVSLCARQQVVSGNVEITKAIYGARDQSKIADVTKKAAALVKKGSRSIEASNGNFGDPANGIPKQLTIHYTVDGVQGRKTVPEGESVTLSSPSVSPAVVDPLLAAFARASGPAKIAVLRILQRAGGPKAFEGIRKAASDGETGVRESAQQMLCDWPTPDALPAVRALATNPSSANVKAPALRAWLRLVPLQAASDEEKLAQVKDALALASGKEEKKAALAALQEIPLVAGLALVVPCLDNPDLTEEACAAAVAIAGPIASQHAAEVQASMKKVSTLTKDKKLAGQAAKIARQTKAK